MRTERAKNILYWITTVLGPASFVMGGVLQLTRSSEVTAAFQHLGYPIYFASILGAWKIAGAVVTVVPRMPRLKEWAYAGFFFDLTAASLSHGFSGDGLVNIIEPLVFLGLVMASWALRPSDRRLAPALAGSVAFRRAPAGLSAVDVQA